MYTTAPSSKRRLMSAAGLVAGSAAALVLARPAAASLDDIQNAIPGARIIYSRNGRIHYSSIDPWQPAAVTEGRGCHWSRDGKHIVFVVGGGDHRTIPSIWMADYVDTWFENIRMVRDSGYIPEFTADGEAITFVSCRHGRGEADTYQWRDQTRTRGGKVIIKRDLATGNEEVLFDSRHSYASVYEDRPLFHVAQLHKNNRHLLLYSYHDMRPHKTSVFDIETRTLLHNEMMWNGDCSPAWSGDYTYITTTREADGAPRCVYRQDFDPHTGAIDPGSCFFSAPGQISAGQNHRHQTDNAEEWLVCASRSDEDSQRDVWIWKIGTPREEAVCLTEGQSGDKDDCDIFIPGTEPPDSTDPADSSGSADSSRPAVPAGVEPLRDGDGEVAVGSPAYVKIPGDHTLRDTLAIMVYMVCNEGIDSQHHLIEPLPPEPEIVVGAPATGAVWPLGSRQHIRWTAARVEQVYIELSYDYGRTYTATLVDAGETINRGADDWLDFTWTVEGRPGDSCIIRVSEYENKAYGVSGLFSIVEQNGSVAKRSAARETSPRITFPAESGERLLPTDIYQFRASGTDPAWYYRVTDTLEAHATALEPYTVYPGIDRKGGGLVHSQTGTASSAVAIYTLRGRLIGSRRVSAGNALSLERLLEDPGYSMAASRYVIVRRSAAGEVRSVSSVHR
jgi:hypothetical protein